MYKTYPAIIERGNDCYGVTFPDLLGCVTVGDTIDDAIEMAHEALALYCAEMIDMGTALPPATPFDQVETDPEIDVVMLAPIRVAVPGKAVRISVTIDRTLLDAIDAVTTNRSAFLADAALAALRHHAR